MNSGLIIGKQDDYIDRFLQNSAELRLLAKGSGTEIMLQKIKSTETVFIEPSTKKETMEFFYILNGEINLIEGDESFFLKQGDYIYTQSLKSTIHFFTLTDTTLLYLSTEPIFTFISDTLRDLTEISKKVEKKDSYTHSHSQRVKEFSVKIACRLGLENTIIQNIVFASLCHDIGKIFVPDQILKKTSKLTSEEFVYIKKHPSDGSAMVKETAYEHIKQIIEQHHERLDGSGYPNALKDEQIKYEAKIIAVADTYDAMTSDRPYRKAFSPKHAIDELTMLSGIHYDKIIVDAFRQILIDEDLI